MDDKKVPRFSALIGQGRATCFLQQAAASGRVAHAYIFSGPEGIGKFAAALAFGALMLCEKNGEEACGQCHACRQVAVGAHGDLNVVRRLEGKDLGVGAMRDMIHKLALKALFGGYKITIIRGAEEMNRAAQNCLLKTLEEPFPDTVIILVTANRAALTPTIISRCQVVRFLPLTRDQVADALVRSHGWEATAARSVAAFSDGSLGKALTLDREFFTSERVKIISQLQRLRKGGFAEVQSLVSKLGSKTDDCVWRLSLLLSWYRDTIRRQFLGAEAELQNEDLIAGGEAVDWREGLRCLQDIHDTVKALKASANRGLAVEALLLRLSSR